MSATLFNGYLGYVGMAPWIAAAAFLVAGVVYLVRAEDGK